MNITKARLIEIIKEEVIKEAGGVAGNFGGVATELGAQRADGNDSPDHDLYGSQQTAEDNFVGILSDIGQMLDIWEEKEYPSDEARYISYFEDLQGLLEQYDPCAHHGQKCDEVHPNQSHEECIEVTINNALYEAAQKRLNEMRPLALRMASRQKTPIVIGKPAPGYVWDKVVGGYVHQKYKGRRLSPAEEQKLDAAVKAYQTSSLREQETHGCSIGTGEGRWDRNIKSAAECKAAGGKWVDLKKFLGKFAEGSLLDDPDARTSHAGTSADVDKGPLCIGALKRGEPTRTYYELKDPDKYKKCMEKKKG
jgi:hypothetical protein